jgi:putative flippase GtrA
MSNLISSGLRFSLVGCLAVLANYLAFEIYMNVDGGLFLNKDIFNVLLIFISILSTFFAHVKFTFKVDNINLTNIFFSYLLTVLLASVLRVLIFHIMVKFDINIRLAFVFSLIFPYMGNFIFYNKVLFRKRVRN